MEELRIQLVRYRTKAKSPIKIPQLRLKSFKPSRKWPSLHSPWLSRLQGTLFISVIPPSTGANPRFKDSLSMRRLGKVCSKSCWKGALMIRAEVKYVNGEEAKRLVDEEGYSVLDIRDRTQYDRAHIKSCRHIPLFIENGDNDFGTIVKRTIHNNFVGVLFGLPFTKLNPDFVQAVKSQFPPDSKLLVVCQEGLRSAVAANKLESEGFQNVSCITSGLKSLKPGTFESTGTVELQNAGKAGLVTIQGKISVVLGTVLISAFLFITLFPDQAEKILQMNQQDSS